MSLSVRTFFATCSALVILLIVIAVAEHGLDDTRDSKGIVLRLMSTRISNFWTYQEVVKTPGEKLAENSHAIGREGEDIARGYKGGLGRMHDVSNFASNVQSTPVPSVV